jgi:hypothetical protein
LEDYNLVKELGSLFIAEVVVQDIVKVMDMEEGIIQEVFMRVGIIQFVMKVGTIQGEFGMGTIQEEFGVGIILLEEYNQ